MVLRKFPEQSEFRHVGIQAADVDVRTDAWIHVATSLWRYLMQRPTRTKGGPSPYNLALFKKLTEHWNCSATCSTEPTLPAGLVPVPRPVSDDATRQPPRDETGTFGVRQVLPGPECIHMALCDGLAHCGPPCVHEPSWCTPMAGKGGKRMLLRATFWCARSRLAVEVCREDGGVAVNSGQSLTRELPSRNPQG